MLRKKLLTLLIVMACALSAAAYTFKIQVLDSEGSPEAYATCRVYNMKDTTRVAVGGITDTLGIYTAGLNTAGDYRMIVEVPGKTPAARNFAVTDGTPDVDLGVITSDVSDLDEVVVTAQRPIVVRELDRIGYDVQADEDSKTSTLHEILRKVPMLNVDNEGNITVNGSSNFKIYKNGRPNSTMSKNAKELFQALPASMIKRIEVITEPGAAYDAEGVAAILNIVTVENTVIKGVMGTASVRTATSSPWGGGSLWLTSQIDKVTFSLNGGVFHQNKNNGHSTTDEQVEYANGTKRQTTSENYTTGNGGYGGLELSWEPSARDLFTVEGNMFIYAVSPYGDGAMMMTDGSGNVLSGYDTHYDYPKYKYHDLDMTASYQRSTSRQGETITLSYMINNTLQDNVQNTTYANIVGDAFPYTAIDANNKLNFVEHTFQADWTRPFAKINTLDVGAKYVLRRNHSKTTSDYEGWQDRFTDFRHVTDIAALYAQYSVKIHKVSLRAGLRYEFSKLQAQYPSPSIPAADDTPYSSNISDWVPSAAASWNINDANSLSFNYSTRINRPGIEYLNPGLQITPTSVTTGNPDLSSARHQSFKLQYMLVRPKATLNFSANYSFSNNSISSLQWLQDNIIYSSYANIGHSRELNFNAFGQFTLGAKTRLMTNLFGGMSSNEWDGYKLTRWSIGGWMSLNQKLPFQVEGEVSAWIMPQWLNGVYSYTDTKFSKRIQPSLSLKRSFLKENRLSVRVGVYNIFGRTTMTRRYVNGPYTGTSTSYHGNGCAAMLSVSYRFGSLNAQVKKTRGRISNDDLTGQGGQGGQSSQGQQNAQ